MSVKFRTFGGVDDPEDSTRECALSLGTHCITDELEGKALSAPCFAEGGMTKNEYITDDCPIPRMPTLQLRDLRPAPCR